MVVPSFRLFAGPSRSCRDTVPDVVGFHVMVKVEPATPAIPPEGMLMGFCSAPPVEVLALALAVSVPDCARTRRGAAKRAMVEKNFMIEIVVCDGRAMQQA